MSFLTSIVIIEVSFLCSILIPMLSSSLASILCTNPRFWAKSICSFTLYPPVTLSGKEETNCLGLSTCKTASSALMLLRGEVSVNITKHGDQAEERDVTQELSLSSPFPTAKLGDIWPPTSIGGLLNYLFKNLILTWGAPLRSQMPSRQIFQIAVTVSLYYSFSSCSLQDSASNANCRVHQLRIE